MPKQRIDTLLVERGLVETRSKAQALILAGNVLAGEQRIDKPGQLVDPELPLRIKGEALKYASRGGLKLEAALEQFGINPEGRQCIDIGASTGGFTDCLLQHGALRVWAIDVGHNQLAWKIRNDPRVTVIEGQNARELRADQFDQKLDLATIDVSFISLTNILPAVSSITSDSADIVALIKPQFEVGKGEVGKKGIVRDPAKHRAVLQRIATFADGIGLRALDLIESPILGAEGNREFLIHLRKAAHKESALSDIESMIINLTTSKP